MKKIIFLLVSVGLFASLPNLAKAEDIYGFLDGKYYDSEQTLKYMCFQDSNCYDLNGKFSFSKEVNKESVLPATEIISLPKIVYITYWLYNSLGYNKQEIPLYRVLTSDEISLLKSANQKESIVVITDKLTTVQLKITSYGQTSIYEDNNLSKIHTFTYDSVQIYQGTNYNVEINCKDDKYNLNEESFTFSGKLRK